MSHNNGTGNVVDELNHAMPATYHAQLGTLLNELITNYNALLAHLDTANLTGIGNANAATYGAPTLGSL